MGKREFLPIEEKHLHDYIEIYLNAYPQGKDLSQEGVDGYYQKQLNVLKNYDDVNMIGAFEDGKLIATMKIIHFDINLFGQMKKAYGIMALGVHPLHKRKGVAREMLEHFHQYILSQGESLALLLPFRIDFYRNLGYGIGTKLSHYKMATRNLPSKVLFDDSDLELKLLDYNHRKEILNLYNKTVESSHGALKKFSEEIRDILFEEEQRHIGCLYNGELVGYATYSYAPFNDCNYTLNTMVISQLVYTSGKVLQKLLQGIRLQSDLAENLIISSGEEDFHHILGSPQNIDGGYLDFGFMETNSQYVGTMYKILDFQMFIEATSHRKFMAIESLLKFNVIDDLTNCSEELLVNFKQNSRHQYSNWVIASLNEKSNIDAVITIRKSDLSSLFMGSLGLAALYRLGGAEIEVSSENNLQDTLDKIDRLFYISKKPFTNTDY